MLRSSRYDLSSPAAACHIAREHAVTAANYHPLPVVLAAGAGEWLTDIDGRRYLDLMSAYSAVSHGHAHPRLVRALTDQASRLATCSRAFHAQSLAPFLEKLVGSANLGNGSKALPANGGAESVETAIKAARRWGYRVKGITAGRAEIVVARHNFHGRTTTIVGFSTDDDYRADFGPFTPGFRPFDFGDIDSLAAAITDRTCAVLIEPIQGEAGIIVPPAGFLAAARRLCDERNVLLILDEIQNRGTVDHAPVYPREVVRRALELSAKSMIIVHNHPSGDPTPSRPDIQMTRQIIEAARALGIDVHDHLIVGRDGVASFKQLGLM